MAQGTQNKRKAETTGVKVLIATSCLAATIAGWAMLPSNDPTAAADAASQPSTQRSPSDTSGSPSDGLFGVFGDQQQPGSSSDDMDLPQVQAPQSSGGWPAPMARSHSSR